MIVKNKISWLGLLFQVKGSSLSETWPRILTVTAVASAVTYSQLQYDIQEYTLTTTPFTLIGVALSIFLGFRNNAAYDRFWEGRRLWGDLVNTSRSLARQAYTLIDSAQGADISAFRKRFIKRIVAFVHALRHHLRDTDPLEELARLLPAADLESVRQSSHRPLAILQQLGSDLAHARHKGWAHELNLPDIDAQFVVLANILGGCERIKNTPIPFTYTVLIHRIVAFYCLALPLGLVDTIGVMTPLVVFLISHAFFGLDAIGDEIEEPFGMHKNDLPLAAISRNIEINLLELSDESDRPEPLAPQNGVLL